MPLPCSTRSHRPNRERPSVRICREGKSFVGRLRGRSRAVGRELQKHDFASVPLSRNGRPSKSRPAISARLADASAVTTRRGPLINAAASGRVRPMRSRCASTRASWARRQPCRLRPAGEYARGRRRPHRATPSQAVPRARTRSNVRSSPVMSWSEKAAAEKSAVGVSQSGVGLCCEGGRRNNRRPEGASQTFISSFLPVVTAVTRRDLSSRVVTCRHYQRILSENQSALLPRLYSRHAERNSTTSPQPISDQTRRYRRRGRSLFSSGGAPECTWHGPHHQASIRAHMEFLAGDAMKGRGSGTEDEWRAAPIGSQMRRLGIEAARRQRWIVRQIETGRLQVAAPPSLTSESETRPRSRRMLVQATGRGTVSGAIQTYGRHALNSQAPLSSSPTAYAGRDGNHGRGRHCHCRRPPRFDRPGMPQPRVCRRPAPATMARHLPRRASSWRSRSSIESSLVADGTAASFQVETRPGYTWNAVGRLTGSDRAGCRGHSADRASRSPGCARHRCRHDLQWRGR